MLKKTVYIGYDLGANNTITDMAILDKGQASSMHIHFDAMTMPGSNTPGQAIPSVYGYCGEKIVFASTILDDPEIVKDVRVNFKCRPSDLMKTVSEDRKQKIIEFLKENWPDSMQCPELYSAEMQRFSEDIITFTNAIFAEENYRQRITDAAYDCDKVVFCVGYPTNWNEFDISVYKGILQRSLLGSKQYGNKTASFIMAEKSRAVFLQIKNQHEIYDLPRGTAVLLIDVDSSAVEITAMTGEFRNPVYYSGADYLGSCYMDYAIQKWYVDQIKEDSEAWLHYHKMIENEPANEKVLTLSCRIAKEQCYSTVSGRARFGDDFGLRVRVSRENIDKLVDTIPLAPLLKNRSDIPAEVERFLGNRSYTEVLRNYLENEKKAIEDLGIKVGCIFLTGGEFEMEFIRRIVEEVFAGKHIVVDWNPSHAVSEGLVCFAVTNDQPDIFVEKIERFIHNSVPEIVGRNISGLAEKLAPMLSGEVKCIIKYHVGRWREGDIATLNDMVREIEKECSYYLTEGLVNNQDFYDIVKNWLFEVTAVISQELNCILNELGFSNLIKDDNNTISFPINMIFVPQHPIGHVWDEVNSVILFMVHLVMGCITAPTLSTLFGVLGMFSMELGCIVIALLTVLPPAWPILVAILGVGYISEPSKAHLSEKILAANIPKGFRKVLTDTKIDEEFKKICMTERIAETISVNSVQKKIAASIENAMIKLIQKRVEEI